jgi:hypothetical protein
MLEFDLRPLSSADVAWKRGSFLYLQVLLVAIGAELLAFLWSERATPTGFSIGTPAGAVDLGLVLAMLGFLSFGGVSVARFLPGAERLTLDAVGVHLIYRNVAREDIVWTDRSGLQLLDCSDVPDALREGTAFRLCGHGVWRRRSLLTRDAFAAVLAEARRRGEMVSVRTRTTGSRGPVIRSYRIRGRA